MKPRPAGDVAEHLDRITGERYIYAILPNAVAQGQVVAENILGRDAVYEGAENMNSLKHLGIPVMAVGAMEGEELRAERPGVLLKLYLQDGRIAGFRLSGDVSNAGIYRSLLNRRVDVTPFRNRLLSPAFGMGHVYTLSV